MVFVKEAEIMGDFLNCDVGKEFHIGNGLTDFEVENVLVYGQPVESLEFIFGGFGGNTHRSGEGGVGEKQFGMLVNFRFDFCGDFAVLILSLALLEVT